MTTRAQLRELATNLWWSWHPEALNLFRRLNPEAFRKSGNNPVAALHAANRSVLEDPGFAREVEAAYRSFQKYVERPPRGDAPHVGYFCMEYGLHESLPLYSGGLGVLAGDHTKTASDLGVPFTAVGLFLREGYFQQHFDQEGRQQARYPALDPAEHPLTLVREEDGTPLTVTVHLGYRPLHLQAWRLDVGRATLYLLDSDFDDNSEALRPLTRRLYAGGRDTRLRQEIILGIGGVRLLRALGIEPDVYHANEGHCTLSMLELLRERLETGTSHAEAKAWVRQRCVFTTHTPVQAGHDRFAPELFMGEMAHFRERVDLAERELLSYGRVHPEDDSEAFTMTVLGLKLSRRANGVSRLNGEVVREQWHALYPDRRASEVPIGHITNGVHLPTWTSLPARDFLKEHLGDWDARHDNSALWKGIDAIPDELLWEYRSALRRRLIDFARRYVQAQSLPQTVDLDPEALTIGFARRFATYKRAPLIFSDPDRAIELFSRADRPLQILYAGKAHPQDEGGKAFIRRIFEMSQHPAVEGRVVFLEDYDMEIGRMLTSGCDVWLNTPRRPMEASGTSGQKIAAHGGLNLSIPDGWWPEGYDGTNGWIIGPLDAESHTIQEAQDAADARALYRVLAQEVIPTFYDRDEAGLPHQWIARMKRAMQTLPSRFCAKRMVRDYLEEIYAPLPQPVQSEMPHQ